MTVLVAELVGRAAELEMLSAVLADVPERGGGLVIRGEPGVGKSALLNAMHERWVGDGQRALRTDGVPSEVGLPLAALHKLVRPVMTAAPGLPPAGSEALSSAFGQADATSPRLFQIALAVLDLLAEVASRGPLLLLVDDTHWLDRSSADVLAFVARRLESDPIFLLASGRPVDDDPLAESALDELELQPLDHDAAVRLLDATADGLAFEMRRTILEAASGNPLALVELPKAFEHGAEHPRDGGWLPMTDRLERAFAHRASGLPGPAKDLLSLAALNDSDQIAEMLAAATIMRGTAARFDQFEVATMAGLVEVDWMSVRFRHPLVRSAVYRSTSPSERQRGHAALAQVVEGDRDRTAWHRAAATLGTDETVAEELEAASQRAEHRGAIADAVSILERAAKLSDRPERRGHRLLHAAELAAELGRTGVSARLSEQAGLLDLDPDDVLRLDWVRELCESKMIGGAQRVAELVGLAASADDRGDPDLALKILVRAGLRCWTMDAGRGAEADVVAALDRLNAQDLDPRRVVIRAYASPFDRAAEVMELVGRPDLVGSASPVGLHLLGHAAACVGAFSEAEALCSAAADGLREQGRLGVLAQALRLQAWASLRRSHWDLAAAAAEECARLAQETRQPMVRADALSASAMLEGLRGDLEAADRLAVQAEHLAIDSGTGITVALIQNGRAVTAAGAGRHREAFEHLWRIYRPADPAHQRMQACWAIGSLAEYAVMSGHQAEARRALTTFESLAARTPSPGVQVALRRARALLAPSEDADVLFAAALDFSLGDWPFERARTQLAFGTWLRRQRRITESRAPLRAARETFDRLGAVGFAERARHELRAAGESSTRRAPEAWHALTPQEMQIARMVAHGLSNKEIGQRLYLSHRTISSHLYRMFPKLGVSSRAQLARLASDRATTDLESDGPDLSAGP